MTEIDGVDIQFAHVRSKHEDALPLLMTHGWPSSIFELLKVVGPLTDPTAHGGSAEDAGAGRTARYPPQHARDRAPSIAKLRREHEPVPSEFSDAEKTAYAQLGAFYTKGSGYAAIMNTRPQTIGYALADSPVGLSAFYYDSSPSGRTAVVSPSGRSRGTRCSTTSRCTGSRIPGRLPHGRYTCINWLRTLPYIRAWPGSTEIGDWW